MATKLMCFKLPYRSHSTPNEGFSALALLTLQDGNSWLREAAESQGDSPDCLATTRLLPTQSAAPISSDNQKRFRTVPDVPWRGVVWGTHSPRFRTSETVFSASPPLPVTYITGYLAMCGCICS